MKLPALTRYIYYISIALIILALGLNISFLYNDFYKTVAQVEIVYMLSGQVSFEVVNINLWNDIEKNIEYKKSSVLKTDEILNNPFSSFDETTIE
ncbi:MAG: hypothetical protein ABIA91_02625 [Patescibacteria group bacterium]